MWADQNTSMGLICPRRLQFVAPELPLGQQDGGGVEGEQAGVQKAAGALCICAGLCGGFGFGHDWHCLSVGGVQRRPPRPRG